MGHDLLHETTFMLFAPGEQGVRIRKNNMISANAPDCRVQMTLKEDSRLRFLLNGVFRQGVRVEILAGSSIRQVIVDQIGNC